MSDVQLPEIAQEHKQMAMYAHIGSAFTGGGVGVLIYLLKGKESPYIAYHAAQSALMVIGVWVTYSILSAVTLGICAIIPLPLVAIGLGIWKGLAAGKGTWEGYPAIGGIMRPPEAG